MDNRGLFISVDGPDGSGKSTIIRGIEDWLNKVVKRSFLITKEPGATQDPACVKMREMLLDPDSKLVGDAELFLMLADRYQHVMNVIMPALNSNNIVVTDRIVILPTPIKDGEEDLESLVSCRILMNSTKERL